MGYRVANQQTVCEVREQPDEYAGGGDRDGDSPRGRGSKVASLRPNDRLSEQEAEEIEELTQEIGTLAAQIHAAEHQFLELIAEFDAFRAYEAVDGG